MGMEPKKELSQGILPLMDSYRAEKKATLAIALPDTDVEIEPVPTSGGGRKPEPEMNKLSNIVNAFNDQFGGGWQGSDLSLVVNGFMD